MTGPGRGRPAGRSAASPSRPNGSRSSPRSQSRARTDEAIAVEESRPDVLWLRIVICDRTESYTYALLPFVVAYGWPG